MSAYPAHARPKCPGGSPACQGYLTRRESIICHRCAHYRPTDTPQLAAPPAEQLAFDRDRKRYTAEIARLKALYGESLQQIEQQQRELGVLGVLDQGLNTFTIAPKTGQGTSEGTVVAVASDWHMEENVGAEVGGLNTFNIEIAKQRATRFFQSTLRLTRLLQQDIHIERLLLPLLGDFITNQIHGAENAEINEELPTHAVMTAAGTIISGIEFLLEHSTLEINAICHSGNHARTSLKTRFSAENGHSLEYLMFLHLAAYFRSEPRVTFLIPPGMHSYVDIYGTTIRLHHGHAIKYGGGVGGIYIPTNKAIAQWNKARHADLDVFGHFHQLRDGGNFICNGSLIGWNAFAQSIKADFEKPKQALFLMDKRRGRTCTWPILLENTK